MRACLSVCVCVCVRVSVRTYFRILHSYLDRRRFCFRQNELHVLHENQEHLNGILDLHERKEQGQNALFIFFVRSITTWWNRGEGANWKDFEETSTGKSTGLQAIYRPTSTSTSLKSQLLAYKHDYRPTGKTSVQFSHLILIHVSFMAWRITASLTDQQDVRKNERNHFFVGQLIGQTEKNPLETHAFRQLLKHGR